MLSILCFCLLVISCNGQAYNSAFANYAPTAAAGYYSGGYTAANTGFGGSGFATPYGSGAGFTGGYNGFESSGSGSGQVNPDEVYEEGSYWEVVPTSADPNPYVAPSAVLETVSDCGDDLRIRDDEAEYVQTPNWPAKYPNNQHCIYKFESRSGRPLKLTFKKFDIEYNKWCNWDYVNIFDGAITRANRLDKLCGSEEDGTFVTKGKVLNLVFHSDSSVQKGGFDAKVEVDMSSEPVEDDQLVDPEHKSEEEYQMAEQDQIVEPSEIEKMAMENLKAAQDQEAKDERDLKEITDELVKDEVEEEVSDEEDDEGFFNAFMV